MAVGCSDLNAWRTALSWDRKKKNCSHSFFTFLFLRPPSWTSHGQQPLYPWCSTSDMGMSSGTPYMYVLPPSPLCAGIKLLASLLALHTSSSAAGKGSARPAWQDLLQTRSSFRARSGHGQRNSPVPWGSGVILLWEGGVGMMPDKPRWKEQENEKNFPVLHKKAQFCDVSLINIYMNTGFVYI